jgi:hypothetical protein
VTSFNDAIIENNINIIYTIGLQKLKLASNGLYIFLSGLSFEMLHSPSPHAVFSV